MGAKSRRKGAAGEREAAKFVQYWSGVETSRAAQNGKDRPDLEDVTIGDRSYIFEVKRRAAGLTFLYKGLEQAKSYANTDAQIPVLMMRTDKNRWLCILDAEDFLKCVTPKE